MQDTLKLWEKLPILGLFLAQGLYVWRWYTGFTPPPWVIVVAGMFAVAAIDGAMVATVMGMRQGRRSRASVAAIVVTALFGAFVALDLYGAVPSMSAWLHAGFALTIVTYLLHTSAPLASARDAATAEAVQRATQAEADGAVLAQRLEAALAQLLAMAHERDAALAQAHASVEVVQVGDAAYSMRQLARVLDIPDSTLRRKLAQVASAAD
jgi:uncharacterized protein YqgC (DUF456 family)